MKTKPYLQMRKDLPGRPEVRQLSRVLNLPRVAIIGALYLVWRWADEQLGADSDRVEWTTAEDLDREADIPGFAAALVSVGWLVVGDSWVEFPGYNAGPGSAARWALSKRSRTEAARESKALKAQAGAVADFTAAVLDGAAQTLADSVTDSVTGVVTDSVTGVVTGGELEQELKEIKTPLSPLEGDQKTLSLPKLPGKPKPDRETRKAQRFFALERIGREAGLEGPVFGLWSDFCAHCRDLGRLPSEQSGRAVSGDLARLPEAVALRLLRGWISGGRWTPGPELAAAVEKEAGGGIGEKPPPVPQGGRVPWRDPGGRGWVSRDAVGLLWWDPGRRSWCRVRETAGV